MMDQYLKKFWDLAQQQLAASGLVLEVGDGTEGGEADDGASEVAGAGQRGGGGGPARWRGQLRQRVAAGAGC
jgi:hypothetical protein